MAAAAAIYIQQEQAFVPTAHHSRNAAADPGNVETYDTDFWCDIIPGGRGSQADWYHRDTNTYHDHTGHNIYGFHEHTKVHVLTGTLYNLQGFKSDRTYMDTTKRYDHYGYNFFGLTGDDYGRDGYSVPGRFEYHEVSRNRAGYDRAGYDRAGYTALGFGRDGYNKITGRNVRGFDRAGNDAEGYDAQGLHKDTRRDREGNDAEGYDTEGYHNATGLDREGYASDSFNAEGYDRNGIHRSTYAAASLDEDV
jgi:hypothetical protein